MLLFNTKRQLIDLIRPLRSFQNTINLIQALLYIVTHFKFISWRKCIDCYILDPLGQVQGLSIL